jgi:hypothetical protein
VRIAFDVDGVLRDLMAVYAPHVDHSVDEITTYDSALNFAGGLDQFLELLDGQRCWTLAKPHPHLLGLYKHIEAHGHTILIATAISTEAGRQGTLEWLCKHDVNYDELHFCVDKLQVRFDAIIEDYPSMALAAARAGCAAFLVHRPWTANVEIKHPNLFRLPPDEAALGMVMEVLDGRSGK